MDDGSYEHRKKKTNETRDFVLDALLFERCFPFVCIETSCIEAWLQVKKIANVHRSALIFGHCPTLAIQVMSYDYVSPCDP